MPSDARCPSRAIKASGALRSGWDVPELQEGAGVVGKREDKKLRTCMGENPGRDGHCWQWDCHYFSASSPAPGWWEDSPILNNFPQKQINGPLTYRVGRLCVHVCVSACT